MIKFLFSLEIFKEFILNPRILHLELIWTRTTFSSAVPFAIRISQRSMRGNMQGKSIPTKFTMMPMKMSFRESFQCKKR